MKKILIILLLFLFFGSSIEASINRDTVKIRLSNPREAVMLHYKYLQEDNYFPEIASKALYLQGINSEEGVSLSKKLKKIFHGRALLVIFSSLNAEQDFIDSASGRSIYFPFNNYNDIYLEKIGKRWRYSKETVRNIPDIYQSLYPLDLLTYIDKLPNIFKTSIFFNMELWQILILFILIAVGYILRQIIRYIVRFILRMLFAKTLYKDFLDKHLRPTARTISSIAALVIIFQMVPMLQLPIEVHVLIDILYRIFFSILIIILLFRVTDYIYDKIMKFYSKKNNKIQENLLPFFRTIFKTILVIIGILGILVSLGFDIWPWMAGLSIGGLAVALAAQETIKNIFGSLTIIADRPFDVGDWIIYDKYEGTVIEIGIRSTTIQTFYNSLITVPNGKLMDVTIDNMGKRNFRRFKTHIDIIYDTPIKLIDAFIKGIKRILLEHPDIRNEGNYVYFHELGASSLKILLWVWFDVESYDKELKTRQDLLKLILDLGRAIGVEFAYPTQTLFVEGNNEADSINNKNAIHDDDIKTKMDSYFKDINLKNET